MTTRTNGDVDVDDPNAVAYALRRLSHIADQLTVAKAETDALYAERMRLVYGLRGHVSQHQLAVACGCGVDMIKNISANARRRYEREGTL